MTIDTQDGSQDNHTAQLGKLKSLKSKNEYSELFNPNRIKPIAGFAKFVKENLDVAKELIEKILPSEKLEELAGLANGEGKVVKYEGKNIALFKDENLSRLFLCVRTGSYTQASQGSFS